VARTLVSAGADLTSKVSGALYTRGFLTEGRLQAGQAAVRMAQGEGLDLVRIAEQVTSLLPDPLHNPEVSDDSMTHLSVDDIV
jgi:hypothetical protein